MVKKDDPFSNPLASVEIGMPFSEGNETVFQLTITLDMTEYQPLPQSQKNVPGGIAAYAGSFGVKMVAALRQEPYRLQTNTSYRNVQIEGGLFRIEIVANTAELVRNRVGVHDIKQLAEIVVKA